MEHFILQIPGGPAYPVIAGLRIGRDPTCQLNLQADTLVSRFHATVWVERGALFIRDERSSNGTFVSGQRLTPGQPRALLPDEEVRIGSTRLLVNGPRPAAAPAIAPAQAAAAAAPRCTRCGAPVAAGRRFCTRCGAPLQPPAPEARAAPAAHQPPRPAPGGMQESLARLGIPVSRAQIISFIASALAGLILARGLPFVYPVLDPLLTLAFGSGPSAARDGFNSFMMTSLTFLTSFTIALVTAFLFRPRRTRR